VRNVLNESPIWGDVNGDGRPELVYSSDGSLGYATYDPAHPSRAWVFHRISPKGTHPGLRHGVGFGDVNGDGRVDIIEAGGWWEQPAHANDGQPWIHHPVAFAPTPAQMCVCDVDGDGLNDVITVFGCHGYGLVWWKQLRNARGEISWERHDILSPAPDLSSGALRISQMHALELADVNGDGVMDIITGKRFWAHGPTGDKEPDAPAVLYWFEVRRDGKGGVAFIPHLIDDDSGVGTQIAAVDLNGDGRPEILASNKKGVHIFFNTAAHPAGRARS
jgi:hypothetical protein